LAQGMSKLLKQVCTLYSKEKHFRSFSTLPSEYSICFKISLME